MSINQCLLSEDAILACLIEYFPNTNPAILLGRGDDCALLRDGSYTVSTDLFLEDIHFRRAYFTAEDIGYKALAVNASDIAACGARPVAFSLCLGLPEWVEMTWLKSFFAGMAQLADKLQICLIGGDLSRCDKLHISITIFGEIQKNGCFLPRGGSMPGDTIFIIGQPGLARVGLSVLERQGRSAIEQWPKSCAAHLRPIPRVDAGLMLTRAAFNARPPALMDVSDGLLRDLPLLLGITGELAAKGTNGNKLGATLNLPLHKLHAEVLQWSAQEGKNPLYEALIGGEDYALLGSCAPDMISALQAAIPDFLPVGVVTSDGAIICNGELLPKELRGFDHFAC